MQEYNNDPRTVLTLDAGGTNFVFSAIKGCREVITPITIPANADNLELSLKGMIEGFHKAKELLNEEPVAISFAFPGPADYPKGIIGDLGNLPAYRGGVAMGTMLEKEFNLPIFVNNDGNLYALGEAANGFLPFVNECLSKNGSSKRFKNIVGFTLGTGFGGGIVTDGRLFLGDNSDSTELWTMSNHTKPDENIESLISIKAVVNSYKSITNTTQEITPKDVFEIATGKKEGDKEAALKCYEKMGRALGDALANMLTIVDGVAVIGGGIS
ncbi:MAG: ROK family protein, partial [Rikenellaceae bacterium]